MTDTITLPRAIIQDTLEFTEFLWRDVHLNDYASGKLDEVMGKLRAALAQQAGQGWQPIESVKPHTEVIVAIEGGSVSTGSMIPNLGWVWNATDDEPEDACVIAWMPLPTPPKEKK